MGRVSLLAGMVRAAPGIGMGLFLVGRGFCGVFLHIRRPQGQQNCLCGSLPGSG